MGARDFIRDVTHRASSEERISTRGNELAQISADISTKSLDLIKLLPLLTPVQAKTTSIVDGYVNDEATGRANSPTLFV